MGLYFGIKSLDGDHLVFILPKSSILEEPFKKLRENFKWRYLPTNLPPFIATLLIAVLLRAVALKEQACGEEEKLFGKKRKQKLFVPWLNYRV